MPNSVPKVVESYISTLSTLFLSLSLSVCLVGISRIFRPTYRETSVEKYFRCFDREGKKKRKKGKGKGKGGIKRRRWISKFGKKYLAGEIQAHAEFWKSSWMAVSQRRSLPDFSRFSIARPTFFPPARQTNAGCQSESIFEITFSRVEAFESFRVRCVKNDGLSTMDNEWVQREREKKREIDRNEGKFDYANSSNSAHLWILNSKLNESNERLNA